MLLRLIEIDLKCASNIQDKYFTITFEECDITSRWLGVANKQTKQGERKRSMEKIDEKRRSEF